MDTTQALMLIARLAGFRHLVRNNRFGCDSDLARMAHDNVIAVLDSYQGELAELIQRHKFPLRRGLLSAEGT
ncbi:hypothetical protein [Shinella granuli]|uniref:Uncharacterized protein n=1 Tax=Shinella granuli TaxID=323621 RepID=A0A4R2C8D2_SHIGR|nr:hypothetical protein [Shinella granuli]TCN35642.1 hypothetical protein EV665_12717 [Shinella granuli]